MKVSNQYIGSQKLIFQQYPWHATDTCVGYFTVLYQLLRFCRFQAHMVG
jgi:hypothetical protein